MKEISMKEFFRQTNGGNGYQIHELEDDKVASVYEDLSMYIEDDRIVASIVLHKAGFSIRRISNLLDVSKTTVNKWVIEP